MQAAAFLSIVAAAAASPRSIFGAPASSANPAFCLPTTGAYHLRVSTISVQGPSGGIASRSVLESFVDYVAGKERQDLSGAIGAFAPTLGNTNIIDCAFNARNAATARCARNCDPSNPINQPLRAHHDPKPTDNAGFAWDYNVKAKTCRKTMAPPRPTPDSQCGAPDGVTYAGVGTQGPISTTIYRSYEDFSGRNNTRTWHVAGDVPVFDSLLHFSSSFENATWAAYERTEFEDYVRRRFAARAAGARGAAPPSRPLPPSRQSRAPIAPAVFVLPPECPK